MTELSHGTLVIAARGKNFVVLGADSKGILGDLDGPIVIGSRALKITILSNHVAAATYGVAEFGENLLDQYQSTKEADLDGVTNVLESFRIFCRDKWNEWFSNFEVASQPHLGFVVAGLDIGQSGQYDTPKMFSIESWYNFAPALHRYRHVCRGIYSLATFIMDQNYREDMDINEVISLVESTISKVAQSDPRIGLPVRIALIDTTLGARMRDEQSEGGGVRNGNES